MIDGVASEWFLGVGGGEAESEMRAAIARSRLGWPQLLHFHAHAEPCNERCDTIEDPAAAVAT